MDDSIIICTESELIAMHSRGEIGPNGYVLEMKDLFEVICEHYGVNPHWQPNDVY